MHPSRPEDASTSRDDSHPTRDGPTAAGVDSYATRYNTYATRYASLGVEASGSTHPESPGDAIHPGEGVGLRLGAYRIERELGRGGMGVVYQAEALDLKIRVAIKFVSGRYLASPSAFRRFVEEGRVASRLNHPRCVFVYAADEHEGMPYIVMELMPGKTLQHLVDEGGPLAVGPAIVKLIDVVDGLIEAHRKGIIHRDIKPSNCFLEHDGRVKIGDFGLAVLLASGSSASIPGGFVGTLHFASPEQYKGEPLDVRSDVYSLAATLFYLLTGRTPIHGDDPIVRAARISSEPAPSIRVHRPEIPYGLERVIARGLERDRTRRHRDLEEFRDALRPFLPGGEARPAQVGRRVGAYVADYLVAYLLASLLLVSIQLLRREFTMPGASAWWPLILSGLMLLGYYGLFEVFGVASPGKRLFRLRVASVDRGGAASRWESAARLVIFTLVAFVPRRAYAMLFAPRLSHTLAEMMTIEAILATMALPALSCTARASNGYRGLHEILSRTAVIGETWSSRRRLAGPSSDDPMPVPPMARPEGLPGAVGPFTVGGAIVWTDARRVLLGEDPALGRSVWVILRPEGTAPQTPARRDVGRLGRPRWLNAGVLDGWAWEAFVAPVGRPLSELVRSRHQLEWHEAREILEALAAELDASCRDGTLPDVLTLDRVWVQPDGRVLLIDEPLDPYHIAARDAAGGSPQWRSLDLLRSVATCTLSGRVEPRVGRPRPVGAPVPGHAIPALERLCRLGRPYASLGEFRADLEATSEEPTELTSARWRAHATYTLVATLLKTWLVPLIGQAAVAVLAYLAGEPLRLLSGELFGRLLLFEATSCILGAMIFPDGLGGLLFGVTVIRNDGRRPSRLHLGWREALYWLPLLVAPFAFSWIPEASPIASLSEYGEALFAGLLPFLYTLYAPFDTGRYLNDRLARTTVMPR